MHSLPVGVQASVGNKELELMRGRAFCCAGILGIKRVVAPPLIVLPLPFLTFAYWYG